MTEQSNVIPFAQPTVWDRAIQERNWCIYAITPADPKTGKKGKFPTNCVPSEYVHEKVDWGTAVSVYHPAQYTFAEVHERVQTLQPPPGIESFKIGYLPRPNSALTIGDLDQCRDPVPARSQIGL